MILWALACVPEPQTCVGEPLEVRFQDRDRDGRGNPEVRSLTCASEQPQDHVFDDSDCDDTNDLVFLFAVELCDGLDNNCDGLVDNGLVFTDFYVDLDGDGFGNENVVPACRPPPGTSERSGDCNDGDSAIHPDADELCDGIDNDCDGLVDSRDDSLLSSSALRFFADQDRDGFGDPEVPVFACVQPPDAVENADDCNDTDPHIAPGALEICNGVDDDCDGPIDDSDPTVLIDSQSLWYLDADQDGLGTVHDAILTCTTPWYRSLFAGDCDDHDPSILDEHSTYWWQDHDGDGFGAGATTGPTCTRPAPGFVPETPEVDCDDTTPAVFPGRLEVCDHRDNDCNGLVDDEDPGIDPLTTPSYSLDSDGDGYGGLPFFACAVPGPNAPHQGDCDDSDAFVFPGANEFCNGIDDNCNGFIDDEDPFLDARDGSIWYDDLDGDGHGDPFGAGEYCEQPEGTALLASDCDDGNSTLGPPTLWWADQDGDGIGQGVPFGPSCEAPQPSWVQVQFGEDCDDGQPSIFPGATEACDDTVDQDCDGVDSVCPRASCEHILADGLSQGSGVYAIAPTGGASYDVWCDMETDGGGWTLVSSSFYPVDDAADGYHANLATLAPLEDMMGIWDGLRPVLGVRSDIRFSCRQYTDDPDLAVDLVFYDSHWYQELTTGTDEEVCFNEDDGAGYDQPTPERVNLLTGAIRESGNDWDDGYLEGEDTCASLDDFTIDFDDRGMDSNQSDGTDWGEDDERPKCATSNRGEAFFIFVRSSL